MKKEELSLDDFDFFGKHENEIRGKYPGKPFVCFYKKEYINTGGYSLYFSKIAMLKMDVRQNEGLRFAHRQNRFYAYRIEKTEKGVYVFNQMHDHASSSGAALKNKGMAYGDYMLADPIHVGGIDLFELVPVAEYEE